MNCSACNRNMTTKSGQSIIAMSFHIFDETMPEFHGFYEVYPELKLPIDANICYACLLKSVGAKI